MTESIPLAQFIQARRELELSPDHIMSQTGVGAGAGGALAEDLTTDLPEVLPEELSEVLPEEGAADPGCDEAAAERQRELEQEYARGRAETLAEFQVWWDDRAAALQEITSLAQSKIEAGILASAINLVHTVSARHIRQATVDQLVQQIREHLQQCADAVPLVTGSSELAKEVAERLEGTGIQVVSSFDDDCEEVLVKMGDTSFETMISAWTQEIESTSL